MTLFEDPKVAEALAQLDAAANDVAQLSQSLSKALDRFVKAEAEWVALRDGTKN
jgi:hypothetical protein